MYEAKILRFTCEDCGHSWDSNKASREMENRVNSNRDEEDVADGYFCPRCDSQNVGSVEIK